MRIKLLASLALLLTLFTSPTEAQQGQCFPKEAVVQNLGKEYGETPIWEGVNPQALIQIFVNQETRSWTIVGITPQGLACLLSSGDGWEPIPYVPYAKTERS